MASLMPNGKQQYFSPSTGAPLAGGLVYTYAAGTSTPKATFADANGATTNANPVVLDSTGSALIFWSGAYKIVVCDPLGNLIYSVDNYSTDSREHPVQVEIQTATAGQTVFTLAQTNYTPGINSLHVYVDGLRMFMPDYAETSSTVVTFASALVAGQTVMFECGSAANSQSALDASIVPYTPGGGGATTNVAAALNGKPDSSALAASGGSALVGFQQNGTGTVARTVQAKGFEVKSLEDFGAKGDGTTDDTAAVQAAFSYTAANGLALFGTAGGNYKVTAKIPVTAGNVTFDGRNCVITNLIAPVSGVSDAIFEIANSSISNVRIRNFRVAGNGSNGHIVAVLGALSTGPQFITVENIWVQNNSGNGKDYTGAAIPAQLLYAYGGMTLKVKECVTYLGGGIWCDSTLKVHISDTTIDSPPAGRLAYMKSCNGVLIDSNCVFNGGVTDQVDIESCRGVTVQANRLKGGTGRQFYAHGSSSNIYFLNNQQEVFDLTHNAVEFTTAVTGWKAHNNSLNFINSGGTVTFTKGGIALVDEPGGGFIGFGGSIEGNGFSVNSNMTITYMISAASTLNSVRALRIIGNQLAANSAAVSGTTITTGISLSGTMTGTLAEGNQYGAPSGATMTTGISVGSSCTGTRLIENTNYGNTTTPIADSGVKTTRREGGVLVAQTYTPAMSGSSTAGVGTYTTQTGTVQYDGDLAYLGINLAWTAHTGTGSNMTINLPFTSANRLQVLHVLSDSLTYTGTLRAAVLAGSSQIRLYSETSNASPSQVAFDSAATLYISGVLETA